MTASRWDLNATTDLPREAFASGSWLSVTDTECKVGQLFVRVSESTDGRLVVTGLHMSGEHEITANTLREVQLAAILKAIAWRERGEAPPPSVGEIGPTGLARFEGVATEVETAVDGAQQTSNASRRGRRGPSTDELKRFTEVYRRHLRDDPYRAVKLTMRECQISRSTAHRHLNRCRELGLLEQREDIR